MKTVKKTARFTVTVILLLLCAFASCVIAGAIDEEFEKSIAAFPESYKPGLRELHKLYPNWKFVPFETGLDWETVIDNEHNQYALVSDYATDRVFKSLEEGDYDKASDEFDSKDGDFVQANRFAVEFFMDPRNFLHKGGIFQFEVLSFDEVYTVDVVEAVLSGSFMSKKKMTYYDANGNLKTDTLTYAQAIYNAGKKYDINPSFLAAKIRNEVGSNGSDSVSGTVSGYKGIYNFYNIGATDGSGAIERGLYWAQGGSYSSTTYGRPWNTPYKSILGGAEFLAEEYIAAGQFTGYLQKFNVNVNSDYGLYRHQYMSNITGALEQGFSSYNSYYKLGLLSNEVVFSIPVFKNMSDEKGEGSLSSIESAKQFGKVNVSFTYVRSGPSIDHERVKDAAGSNVYIENGTAVRILGKFRTDAYYHPEIYGDPIWYKIYFKCEGTAYTGYIPGSYVDISTVTCVPTGKVDLSLFANNVTNKLLSTDPGAVRIIDSDTVEFLKAGTYDIIAYDSLGHFERIKFKVNDNYKAYNPESMTVVSNDKAIKVTVAKNSLAKKYGFYLYDGQGNYIVGGEITSNTYTFKNLDPGVTYKVYARISLSNTIYGKSAGKAIKTKTVSYPDDVTGVKAGVNESSIRLTWDKSEGATGYRVYYLSASGYKVYCNTSDTTVTFSKLTSGKKYQFAIRAFKKTDSSVIWCKGYEPYVMATKPKAPVKIASAQNASVIKLSWAASKGATGYRIYYKSASGYKLCATVKATIHTFKNLKAGAKFLFAVRPYISTPNGTVYGKYITCVASTVPAIPKTAAASLASRQITVKWNAVNGADGYQLYYKTSKGYKLFKVYSKPQTVTFNNLKSGNKYTIAIRAYIKTSGGYVFSSYTPVSVVSK